MAMTSQREERKRCLVDVPPAGALPDMITVQMCIRDSAKTALLIFGAILVAGVAASAGILLRRPETETRAKP